MVQTERGKIFSFAVPVSRDSSRACCLQATLSSLHSQPLILASTFIAAWVRVTSGNGLHEPKDGFATSQLLMFVHLCVWIQGSICSWKLRAIIGLRPCIYTPGDLKAFVFFNPLFQTCLVHLTLSRLFSLLTLKSVLIHSCALFFYYTSVLHCFLKLRSQDALLACLFITLAY